ncbi:bifunctional phosphopantothenoylcysteine decarboxylase/phosphopantothenate--cysteine ligase CoaBC [Thermovenabulum gondwanense]|uniref:Coenzyme A biosynthesis bifunctional protein CoaBC n=1 Tax=Thermovenabulum gondwanense TaxID=520767 RepID=A0A162MMX0_9FIRM|nr:bifunctional phosphopantothenoylcysteine decarboxylase/phosphopantothenate--cysteine ligase CoaBC [Thermovenabulum gondwanense]KYO66747.1 Coenzyme A biosynthesis bifunctional protein CoaBC [Thermovenabulum gondwanense]
MLKGKFILLGVTGSIAAYKACELTRLFKKRGAYVQVVMTESACKFVAPLTFQILSENPVIKDMFKEPSNWEVEHVSLADKTDIFVIAPATANIIAKLASGIADDMLTTTFLATKATKIIVPAMNVNMYENPITQRNINILKKNGCYVIEPDEGFLACGKVGKGRFPAPEDIIDYVEKVAVKQEDLKGIKILITAGPTREYFDPVRFISNRSSGKMGYKIAEAALERGAEVALISGPVSISPPEKLHLFHKVETAEEMKNKVNELFQWADVIIKAAAVSDYRPKHKSEHKIKKSDEEIVIELVKNPDILKELGEKKGEKILVGFAAETDLPEGNAREKLIKKNLDMIVLNDVTKQGAGFEVDTNIVKILYKSGKIEEFPLLSKKEVAHLILDRIKAILKERA